MQIFIDFSFNNDDFWMNFIFMTIITLAVDSTLPEIPVECSCNTQDDYGMDHIPMIPACTCGRPLFRCCCSKYQTLYFSSFGCFCAKADNNCQDDAEEEHPSAEEQPVHIIEQGFEQVVGCVDRIAVINFGSQAGNTDDDTSQSTTNTNSGPTIPGA